MSNETGQKIVNGEEFLRMPASTTFRSINLNTNKPFGPILIKTGNRIADVGDKIIGYYFKYPDGEESSSTMLCPAACKFAIISNNSEPSVAEDRRVM